MMPGASPQWLPVSSFSETLYLYLIHANSATINGIVCGHGVQQGFLIGGQNELKNSDGGGNPTGFADNGLSTAIF